MECPNCGNLNAPTSGLPCHCGAAQPGTRLAEAEAFVTAYLAEDDSHCGCPLCEQARAYREKWMHMKTREEMMGR